MLTSVATAIVRFCTRFPWPIIVLGLIAAGGASVYAVRHFAINTDINKLISDDLDWRQREAEFEKAFPSHYGSTLIVVDAPLVEYTSRAGSELANRLREGTELFRSVEDTGGSEFFARNGLLFQSTEDVSRFTQGIGQAAPIVGTLVADPSLRGLTRALSLGLVGVQSKLVTLDAMARPLSMASQTIEDALAGRPASFSWQSMLNGQPPEARDLRRLIEVRPVLDFSALQPGQASSNMIRQAASDLQLAKKYQARVRLTGSVPMPDEEFATVQQGALENGIGTIIVVLTILWLALKSARLIVAVFVNLVVGLALTAAFGLMMVGALNMISVAFAVLFVGLGVDFGIQFSVRYRAERHDVPELHPALMQAAEKIGVPLTLAAAAVAAGFLSFLPTDYRGVSELGQIAGMGMLVAYVTSITLLPALLKVLNPKGEPEPLGFSFLAPVDRFMEDHRIAIIAGVAIVSLGGLPLLYYLQFDFNPINLRSPKVESIATFLDLRKDPITGANAISVLAPNLAATRPIEERLSKVPEVSQVRTLDYFVPPDQDKKLAAIAVARDKIMPSFAPDAMQKPPTDAEDIDALNDVVTALNEQAGKHPGGPGAAAAKRLSGLLAQLAKATPQTRQQTAAAFLRPLKTALADLKDLLQAHPVALKDVPQEISELWVTPDGRARVEVLPKGDPNDNETLRKFARAVLAVQPDAIGGPVSILESGDTIVHPFFEGGAGGPISDRDLLWVVPRRVGAGFLALVA